MRVTVHVSARQWSSALLEGLAGRVTGILLGDVFCQKRSFAHGWFDVPGIASRARELGLDVVFQTPAYDTPRTFETTVTLVQQLADRRVLNAVAVHDVGLLRALAGLDGVELWWDRFSFNRDVVPNLPLIEFLKAQQVRRVEVLSPADAPHVTSGGCAASLRAFGPAVASFGRVCYTEYFLSEPCGTKLLCHRQAPVIASVDRVPLAYLADGFTLLDRTAPEIRHDPPGPDSAAAITGLTGEIRSLDDLPAVDEVVRLFDEARARR